MNLNAFFSLKVGDNPPCGLVTARRITELWHNVPVCGLDIKVEYQIRGKWYSGDDVLMDAAEREDDDP